MIFCQSFQICSSGNIEIMEEEKLLVRCVISTNGTSPTIRKSINLDNSGQYENLRRVIQPALPQGTITSCTVYYSALNADSNPITELIVDKAEKLGLDLNALFARMFPCAEVAHWFLVIHINGTKPGHHHQATCHVILEKDQGFVHISENDNLDDLLWQRRWATPDQQITTKKEILLDEDKVYEKQIKMKNLLPYLLTEVATNPYSLCKANCQHFVLGLLDSVGLARDSVHTRMIGGCCCDN